MYKKNDISFLKIKSQIDINWLVEDLNLLLTVINEIYNIFLAYDMTIYEFYRTTDRLFHKLESRIHRQILKKIDFFEIFEDSIKHIRSYVSDDEVLHIKELFISSKLRINFQGVDKILKIIKEVLYKRDFERIDDMLRLKTQYPNEPTVIYYSETLLLKMRRKFLKQANKLSKLQKKYKIIVEE